MRTEYGRRASFRTIFIRGVAQLFEPCFIIKDKEKIYVDYYEGGLLQTKVFKLNEIGSIHYLDGVKS